MYYRSTSKKSYGDVPVHGPFGRIFSRESYIVKKLYYNNIYIIKDIKILVRSVRVLLEE